MSHCIAIIIMDSYPYYLSATVIIYLVSYSVSANYYFAKVTTDKFTTVVAKTTAEVLPKKDSGRLAAATINVALTTTHIEVVIGYWLLVAHAFTSRP